MRFEAIEMRKERRVGLELGLALQVDEELQGVRGFDIAQLFPGLRVANGEVESFFDALTFAISFLQTHANESAGSPLSS
jgi:hypothetical protein